MTRDIIRMARDCGINFHQAGWPELERFFHMAQAAEREAVCGIVTGLCISDNNAAEINRAIRARGQT